MAKYELWLSLAILIAMFTCVGSAQAQGQTTASPNVYKNPINLGNMGDPFVFRWNGRYYLYPTVGGQGLRTWISKDLVNWQHYGYVTQEQISKGAYAPEVHYWNGSFYMYLSRNNDGHYVLKSDSPTGPFVQMTNSLGLSIDGSVFIDNDGQWYFTHAGGRGIRGHKMSSPYKIGPEVRLESDLGGWTEGPGILQRNGYYFMTYTGNHFLSKGYRVNYSVSEKGPLGPYEIPENNPIVISTTDDFSGLGHNSNVIGPDLDSYYMAYHNRQVTGGSAVRLLNIDRLVFNGKKMVALGPTNWPQQAPKMADFYTWIDEDGLGDRWIRSQSNGADLVISKKQTQSDFTAEFNFLVQGQVFPTDAMIGAVLSYQDPAHYVYASVDITTKSLTAVVIRNGNASTLGSAQLPADFDFTKLHTIRIEKSRRWATIFFDNMQKMALDLDDVAGGSIGYISRHVNPVFRYTAFSNDVAGSSDYDVPKPIPGDMEAIHYTKSNGHYAAKPIMGNLLRSGDSIQINRADGTYVVQLASPGDWLKYNINVKQEALYGVDLMVKAPWSAATLELLIDGAAAQELEISAPLSGDLAAWHKVRAGYVRLPGGFHTLTLRLVKGTLEFQTMSLYQVNLDAFSLVDPLTQGVSPSWQQYGAANWVSNEQGFRLAGPGDGKVIIGENAWTDYTVEADVKLDTAASTGEAGLLLRATNVSYYETQVVDSLMGYYVAFNGRQVSLKRLNYDATGPQTLQSAELTQAPGEYGRLKVEAVAGNIKVYWGDGGAALIDYTDPNAFMYGAVGLRASRSDAAFRNLSVQCASCAVYGKARVAGQSFWIQPHTAKYDIELPFDALEPPAVEIEPLVDIPNVRLVDPQMRIFVEQAAGIPGVAHIRVVQPDGAVVHSVAFHIKKETTPTIKLGLVGAGTPGTSDNVVSDTVRFSVDVNGPQALLRNGNISLKSKAYGAGNEVTELYAGQGLPGVIDLDTLQLADGAYLLDATVESVYGSTAQATLEFFVKNWNELTDEMLSPITNSFFGGISRDETVERSGGWTYATDRPEAFFGDEDRLTHTGDTDEYLVWKSPKLREFAVTLYSRSRFIDDRVTLAVSSDMETWTAVPYTSTLVGASEAGWCQLRLVGAALPTDAVYFRLTVAQAKAADAELQIGQVYLRSQAGN